MGGTKFQKRLLAGVSCVKSVLSCVLCIIQAVPSLPLQDPHCSISLTMTGAWPHAPIVVADVSLLLSCMHDCNMFLHRLLRGFM